MTISKAQLASIIDHTLLAPDATPNGIRHLCAEARTWHFAAVCVTPRWAALTHHELLGSNVKTCCVVGFPLGASTPAVKAYEAERAITDGADEVDMVISIGDLKSGNDRAVKSEIAGVVTSAAGRTVKVIIETCLLTDDEKVRACRLAEDAGAAFVKTSTGFSKAGATIADVALMRHAVSPHVGVKASGGIRTWADALAMVEAGASRIGTSAGVKIVSE